MKKILFLLIALLAFASCEKKGIPQIKVFDSDVMITLRPASQTRVTIPNLTALEIVEQAVNIKWQSHYFGNVYSEDVRSISRGFGEHQKDYNKPALLMFGIDVIAQDYDLNNEPYHFLTREFLYGFNVYITTAYDTIAYVPDNVIATARPLIEASYNNEDYDEVYRLFNEAFTFLPIE